MLEHLTQRLASAPKIVHALRPERACLTPLRGFGHHTKRILDEEPARHARLGLREHLVEERRLGWAIDLDELLRLFLQRLEVRGEEGDLRWIACDQR